MNIVDYRLMQFTIFNNAVLRGFDPSGFKYRSPDEDIEDILERAQWAKEKGYSL